MFENGVLGRISGAKTEGVTGDWKNLLNEELHNLYSFQTLLGRLSQE